MTIGLWLLVSGLAVVLGAVLYSWAVEREQNNKDGAVPGVVGCVLMFVGIPAFGAFFTGLLTTADWGMVI